MSPRPREDDWDFTPVIDLIYSLSIREEAYAPNKNTGDISSPLPKKSINSENKNGFEQNAQLGNFDKIWQYLGQPLDLLPPKISPVSLEESPACLTENGVDEQSPLKEVRWRDEVEGADLADNDENDDSRDLLSLTKAQRKKARRKQRHKEQTEVLTDGKVPPSGSEDESGKDTQATNTPNRQAVIYEILHGTSTPETATGRLRPGKIFRSKSLGESEALAVAFSPLAKQAIKILKPQKEDVFAAAAAKKVNLIAMLTETFIDERQYLSNYSLLQQVSTNTKNAEEGIHVFVDASNIMIGFHDSLKMSRGLSINQRIRRQPLSFQNFSLILERGRPTAKRIVVGSDNFPAISEAKAIGYETNILDRVHKAKELTPRQKRFSNINGHGTGTGSGSETTAATAVQFAPEKWVEQAVDEILHLKMMESVVDAIEPSTMVLATGDAAEAEYSEGFLKMVERALGKGWRIELASFRHNTSGAYKRKEFRQKWGTRFKIVELDGFVEALLGIE